MFSRRRTSQPFKTEVEANINDGLLTLTMPKVAEAKARKIAVNNGASNG